MKRKRSWLTVLALTGLLYSCTYEYIETDPLVINVPADTFVFAVIGDYGLAGPAEDSVARMVRSWNPDFILTTGDNNYPSGEYGTLNENISAYYGDYIYNYDAPEEYRCSGPAADSAVNRFFPCPGNHDAKSLFGLRPYLDFFTLPGEEAFYSFTWGNTVLFSLNSLSDRNVQKGWLQNELSLTDKKFRIVYFHHAPYSPGPHGNEAAMQWPYALWGADLVLSGHDHIYSRTEKADEPGFHYIVTGAGGKSLYSCDTTLLRDYPFTTICTSRNYGAVYGKVTDSEIFLAYYMIDSPSVPFDTLYIRKN